MSFDINMHLTYIPLTASYLSLITYLRKLLSSRHKKSYTISVGKPTPSKLANFLEIECFILVACPENTLLLNDAIPSGNQRQNGGYSNKEFSFKPIITPFELQLALREEVEWTGRFVLDFEEIIREGGKEKEGEGKEEDEAKDLDEPRFSLVTGKYRHPKIYGHPSENRELQSSTGSIVLRNQDSAVSKLDTDSAAGNASPASHFIGSNL
jgi:diphthamide biosynthesis protein 2